MLTVARNLTKAEYDIIYEGRVADSQSLEDELTASTDGTFGQYLGFVQAQINNANIRLQVTQSYIDGNNESRRIAIAAATTIAVGRAAQLFARILSSTIPAGLVETGTAVSLSETLQSTDWYNTSLEAGDVLVFSDGGLLRIERASEQAGSNGDNNDGQDGTNTGGGAPFLIDSYPTHIVVPAPGQPRCIIAFTTSWTGQDSVTLPQIVCF